MMMPFDVTEAQRGDAMRTRHGDRVVFVAFVERTSGNRVVVHCLKTGEIWSVDEDGYHDGPTRPGPLDVFMGRFKVTVFMNVRADGRARWYESDAVAKRIAYRARAPAYMAVAVPVEMEIFP